MATAREIWDAIRQTDQLDHERLMDLTDQWRTVVVGPILDDLLERDPEMPHLTALVQAQDRGSAIRADFMLEDGMPWQKAMFQVGSYARAEWVKRHSQDGDIDLGQVDLVSLWRDSDPDDTDAWWALQWYELRVALGEVITDGTPLPDGDEFHVYRGQFGETVGMAWSLDKRVAENFARTGGGRFVRAGGVLLHARVRREAVLAYLTSRGEQEIVVSPAELVGLRAIGEVVKKGGEAVEHESTGPKA